MAREGYQDFIVGFPYVHNSRGLELISAKSPRHAVSKALARRIDRHGESPEVKDSRIKGTMRHYDQEDPRGAERFAQVIPTEVREKGGIPIKPSDPDFELAQEMVLAVELAEVYHCQNQRPDYSKGLRRARAYLRFYDQTKK